MQLTINSQCRWISAISTKQMQISCFSPLPTLCGLIIQALHCIWSLGEAMTVSGSLTKPLSVHQCSSTCGVSSAEEAFASLWWLEIKLKKSIETKLTYYAHKVSRQNTTWQVLHQQTVPQSFHTWSTWLAKEGCLDESSWFSGNCNVWVKDKKEITFTKLCFEEWKNIELLYLCIVWTSLVYPLIFGVFFFKK